jgi:type IV pilus assembly protein PilX
MGINRTDHSVHSVCGSPLAPRPLSAFAKRSSCQHGYVLVFSILILLLITMMSISMAKSFFLEEGMAGNIREKSRAFNAAQAALAYGEFTAKHNTTPGGVICAAGGLAINTVCNTTSPVTVNPTSNTSTLPLNMYFLVPVSYLNTSMLGGADTYYAVPGVHVQYLGRAGNGGSSNLYLVTAFGYGATQNSVAVVQSTYVAVAQCGGQGPTVVFC